MRAFLLKTDPTSLGGGYLIALVGILCIIAGVTGEKVGIPWLVHVPSSTKVTRQFGLVLFGIVFVVSGLLLTGDIPPLSAWGAAKPIPTAIPSASPKPSGHTSKKQSKPDNNKPSPGYVAQHSEIVSTPQPATPAIQTLEPKVTPRASPTIKPKPRGILATGFPYSFPSTNQYQIVTWRAPNIRDTRDLDALEFTRFHLERVDVKARFYDQCFTKDYFQSGIPNAPIHIDIYMTEKSTQAVASYKFDIQYNGQSVTTWPGIVKASGDNAHIVSVSTDQQAGRLPLFIPPGGIVRVAFPNANAVSDEVPMEITIFGRREYHGQLPGVQPDPHEGFDPSRERSKCNSAPTPGPR